MANGGSSGQAVEVGLVEDVGDKANAGYGLKLVVVDGDDSGAFLATVLEGVEGKVAEARGLWVAVDAHNAALFARLFVIVVKGFFFWECVVCGDDDVGDWILALA